MTKEDKKLLVKGLQRHFLFSGLDKEDQDLIIGKMKRQTVGPQVTFSFKYSLRLIQKSQIKLLFIFDSPGSEVQLCSGGKATFAVRLVPHS